jgi:hypothetical protein
LRKPKKPAWMAFVVFVVAAAVCLAAPQSERETRGAGLREALEAEYGLFLAAPLFREVDLYSSDIPYSPQALAFGQRIAVMGPDVLPFLMEKLKGLNKRPPESARAQFLASGVCRVARRWFAPEEWPGGKIGGPDQHVALVLAWWEAGQKGTTGRFEHLYSEWKRLKTSHSVLSRHTQLYEDTAKTISLVKNYDTVTEMGRTFEAIGRGLGLGALPPLMDKLRAGDYDVLPFIAQITREEATSLDGHEGTLEERARRCLEWWDRNKDRWTIPFPDVVETAAVPTAAAAEHAVAGQQPAPPAGQPQPRPDGAPATVE